MNLYDNWLNSSQNRIGAFSSMASRSQLEIRPKTAIQLLLLLVVALIALPAAAQNQVFVEVGVAELEAGAAIPPIFVGDALPVEVRVVHPTGVRLIPIDLLGEWGDVEVLSVLPPVVSTVDEATEQTIQQINVTAWEVGDYQTPPLDFKLSDQQGNLYDVSAETIQFSVQTILTPEDVELRDLKPQASLPFLTSPYVRYALVALGLVGLGLLAFIGRTALKMRTQPEAPTPVIDTRPAHVVALAELGATEQKGLIEEGQYQQYYTEISDTLRRYLESAFRIPAVESTTFEIREALKSADILNTTNQRHLIGLLQEADLVKFADFAPRPDDAAQFPREARQFVTMTAERTVVNEVVDDSAETTEAIT